MLAAPQCRFRSGGVGGQTRLPAQPMGDLPRPEGCFPVVLPGVDAHVLTGHKGAVKGNDWNELCADFISTRRGPLPCLSFLFCGTGFCLPRGCCEEQKRSHALDIPAWHPAWHTLMPCAWGELRS